MKQINNMLGTVSGRGGAGRNNAIVIRVWALFYSVLDPGCLEQCLAHSRCSIKRLKQNRRK